MDRERERKHLAEADRHIAECKSHIVRQHEILKKFAGDTHGAELADSMLHALEGSLRALERLRALIMERLHDLD